MKHRSQLPKRDDSKQNNLLRSFHHLNQARQSSDLAGRRAIKMEASRVKEKLHFECSLNSQNYEN